MPPSAWRAGGPCRPYTHEVLEGYPEASVEQTRLPRRHMTTASWIIILARQTERAAGKKLAAGCSEPGRCGL